MTTVDTAAATAMSTTPTGDMHRPRWYPSGILLPTGEVMAFSGADRDEVATPGLEFPVKQAELWNPQTGDWRPVAEGHQPRTYHNSAALLPDGRILIGGHAPITTLYLQAHHRAGRVRARTSAIRASSSTARPYLFRGSRPRIVTGPASATHGGTIQVTVDGPAADIENVVLVRNASQTHLVDGDQRTLC